MVRKPAELVMAAVLLSVFISGCGYQVEENIEGTPGDTSADAELSACAANMNPEPDALLMTPGQESNLAIGNLSGEPVTIIDIFMTGNMAFQFLDNPIARANVDEIVIPASESLNIRVVMLEESAPPDDGPAASGAVEVECIDEDGTIGVVIIEMLMQ